VQHALPISNVLFTQRRIQTIEVTRSRNVRRRCSFAKHLRNGISRNKMDHQKNETDHQPDDGEGIQHALEKWFQFSISRYELVIILK
jgi:hypothetical protein